MSMKFKFEVKTYTDKMIILPREEFSYKRSSNTFTLKIGWLIWDLRLSLDF